MEVRSHPVARREPQVRALTVDDISEALAAGMKDFRAAPVFGLVFGAICAIVGNVIVMLAGDFGLIYLAYPVIAGFALVAPAAAVGFYEISRRLERGEPIGLGAVLAAIAAEGGRELGYMALVGLFALLGWLYSASFLYALFFGLQPAAVGDIVAYTVTSPRGLAFLVVGNVIGAVMATILFAISVVSYPLLIDRPVDFVTAMITSIRAVAASPGPMLGWGIFLATVTAIASLPMFLGLIFVLPVLGHATWHVYRRAVLNDDLGGPLLE
jgi:uncharacterized membrane protein